jgi:hypothetical protein
VNRHYCRAALVCQGGGAATQMPAEHYHSGSNPDLGFFKPFLKDSNAFLLKIIIYLGMNSESQAHFSETVFAFI